MDNIDDLMRQKFDSDDPGERFEFQEEFWEQAEVLLQAEDERRKRRAWLFWLSLALLLFLLTFGWCYYGKGNSGLTQHNANQPTQSPVIQPNTPAQQQGSTSAPSPEANPDQNPEKPSFSTLEKPVESTSNFKQSSEFSQNNRNRTIELPANLAQKPVRDRNGHWKMANKDGLNNTTPSGTGNAETTHAQRTSEVVAPENAQTTATLNVPNSTGQPSETERLALEKQALNMRELEKQYPFLPLSVIWVQPPLLPVPNRAMPKKKPTQSPDIADMIKPAKSERKFSAGFSLLASWNTPDLSSRRLGMAPGLFAQYRITEPLTLRIGAQYRITPGYSIENTAMDSLYKDQYRYSFGYKKVSYELQTRALHHLEVPLSVQWNRKRFGIEAGAIAGLLTMVQQSIKTVTEASLQSATETNKNFVVGDRAPYRPYYVTGFLGAAYHLNSRWSVAARAHYRFTTLEKPVADGAVSRPGFFDLGVRYRFY